MRHLNSSEPPIYRYWPNMGPSLISASTRSRPARNHEYDNDLEAPRLQLQKYNYTWEQKPSGILTTLGKSEVSDPPRRADHWDAGA